MDVQADQHDSGDGLVGHARRGWRGLQGTYLQWCGERGRWLPVNGPHHLLPGIEFEFGRVNFTNAQTGEPDSVALADDFGEVEMATGNGVAARLTSSGRCAAVLTHPDGATTERLRCNRYSTQIVRHAVTRHVTRTRLGPFVARFRPGGRLLVGEKEYSLRPAVPWAETLPDGATLEYVGGCHLMHRDRGQVRTLLYSAAADSLLEVDYHRVEIHFVWVTSESESPGQLLDGLLTVYPEDGSVQVMHHSAYGRGEPIDFVGPGGLRVLREPGADRLWAYQGEQLIGVAEFVPGGGYDRDKDRSFHRWRFSPGAPVEAPGGTGWYSPLATAAVLLVPLFVAASIFVSDEAAYLIGVPAAFAFLMALARKEARAVVRHATTL